jgi:hypothetical protein
MAGKTFTGIGIEDLLKEVPPVGPDGAAPEPVPNAVEGGRGGSEEGDDIRGVYSGPTVVDDDKVAEGLKRLRSLERTTAVGTGPPALNPLPEGEVSELVADMDSSEPTKIGMPHQRPTAVGRSQGDDVPGQQMIVQPDNLRGTMFGHSVHLPDLQIPIDTDEGPSGPLYVPPKPAPATQLVPYRQPAHTMPNVDASPKPGPTLRRGAAFPPNEPDLRTETIPPLGKRTVARTAAAIVGLALLGGGGLAFRYYRANDVAGSAPPTELPVSSAAAPGQPRPSSAAAAPSEPAAGIGGPAAGTAGPAAGVAGPPPGAAGPPGTAAAAEPPPAPAAKASPSGDPPLGDSTLPKHERAAATGEARPASAPPPLDDDAVRARRRPARPERRRAAAATPATVSPAPEVAPKAAPHRKSAVDEDPDATLPPSTVE